MIGGLYFAGAPFAGMLSGDEPFFSWYALRSNTVVGWRIQQV